MAIVFSCSRLLNLIMNACEAMSDTDSGDRSLAVSTARDGDSNLQLTVVDRGPGISSDMVDRIFEPFVTTKAQGLGLGLSICRSIVAAHGGRLWVVNNPDRGASVLVSLPIHAGATNRRRSGLPLALPAGDDPG